ncbi:hypothetical protein ACFYXD_35220 [Streptomyces platensis]|uniref:hypothetical protein n=1 Tax=Streptomyces platensis TaxID=58346 RepID=UPI0036C224DB
MSKGLTTPDVRSRAPRSARPVVPIRTTAEALRLEHAVAFAGLVQAAMAAAPTGSLGDPAAVHAITDPDTGNLIGGGQLPDHVVRTLTAVYREATNRLTGDDDLTALMDAVAEPRPQLLALAGGAR